MVVNALKRSGRLEWQSSGIIGQIDRCCQIGRSRSQSTQDAFGQMITPLPSQRLTVVEGAFFAVEDGARMPTRSRFHPCPCMPA